MTTGYSLPSLTLPADLPEPYATAARTLLAETGCVISRWRRDLTGVAWTDTRDWLIEVPPPSTARRFHVFAHEIAHQVLHRRGDRAPDRQRWREEVEATEWAIAAAMRFGVPVDADVIADAHAHIRYALRKSSRRRASWSHFARHLPPIYWHLLPADPNLRQQAEFAEVAGVRPPGCAP